MKLAHILRLVPTNRWRQASRLMQRAASCRPDMDSKFSSAPRRTTFIPPGETPGSTASETPAATG